MKTALFTLLLCTSFQSAFAKGLIGTVDHYMIKDSNRIIEIGSTEISDDGTSAKYFDYELHKRLNIQMDQVKDRHLLFAPRHDFFSLDAGALISY